MSKIRASLRPHPACQDLNVSDIDVTGERGTQALTLSYSIAGNLNALRIPEESAGQRTDELWQHTCLELFVRPRDADCYYEFNFAPSGDWAAYQFEAYRDGGRDLQEIEVQINTKRRGDGLTLAVTLTGLPSVLLQSPVSIGLSAVIEPKNSERSYWALHHPLNKPDFHHTDGFTLNLD